MSNDEKIRLLEEVMELEKGTLQAGHALEDYEEWDSLTVISYMAFMDARFHKTVPLEKVKGFVTVADVIASMEL